MYHPAKLYIAGENTFCLCFVTSTSCTFYHCGASPITPSSNKTGIDYLLQLLEATRRSRPYTFFGKLWDENMKTILRWKPSCLFSKQAWRNIVLLLVSILSIWHFFTAVKKQNKQTKYVYVYIYPALSFSMLPPEFKKKGFWLNKSWTFSVVVCSVASGREKNKKNGNNSIPIRHRPCCVASRWRREDGGKN